MINNKINLKQKKLSILINNYLNKIFLLDYKYNNKNIIITVINVKINKSYNNSNVYITIYPKKYKNIIFKKINKNKFFYKKKLSFLLKKKFKIPNLNFFYFK
ncbi:MAG: hypothetical protein NHF95_00280 [Candidatus Shikimatogenerans sp. JK-2022]|nr:hypothetical protein [Candidatus Shikimatogenerans bostrichidophilus]